MKIGVDATFIIPGEPGGIEIWFRKIMALLPEIMEKDEFVIFANEENLSGLSSDLSAFDNVTVVRTHVSAVNRARRLLFEQFGLPGIVKTNGIDALFCPGGICPIFRKCGCPIISLICDMRHIRFPDDFSKAELRTANFFIPRTAKRSARIITVSEFSRREIADLTGIPFDKIDVVCGAADDVFAVPIAEDFMQERRMILLHTEAPYILCVADSHLRKNIGNAVRAFGRLPRAEDMRFVLVGKPRRGEADLRAAVAELPDKSRFIRLSHVMESDLAVLYQGAALFVFPSLYEGLGLPVLEAMRAETPVVAMRTGGVPEAGGAAAAYAEPDDPDSLEFEMERMLGLSPEDRAKTISKQKTRETRFSWRNTANSVAASLRKAAALEP